MNLEVVIGNALCWLSVYDLEVKVICLGYCANGSGTNIALGEVQR